MGRGRDGKKMWKWPRSGWNLAKTPLRTSGSVAGESCLGCASPDINESRKATTQPPCSARGGRAQEGRNRSPYGKAKSRPAHRPAAENPTETAPVTRTRPVHGHGLLCMAWLAGVTKPPFRFPLFCTASSFPLISCRPSTLLISRSSELQK